MLASIWDWLTMKASLLLGVVVTLYMAFLQIRKSGKDAQQNESLKATIDAIKKKEEVKREVDSKPISDISDRLRNKWSRD